MRLAIADGVKPYCILSSSGLPCGINSSGQPNLSTAVSFHVLVTDYLLVAADGAVVRTNQPAHVPVTAYSVGGVSSLEFLLEWPCAHLTNVVIEPVPHTSLSLVDQGPCARLVIVEADAGHELLGTRPVANIGFTAISTRSTVVSLVLTQASAINLAGSNVATVVTAPGRIVIVAAEPLLEARRGPNAQRLLTLYGIPGASYQIIWTNALPFTASPWPLAWRVGLADMSETFHVTDWSTNGLPLFFHAYEFTAQAPIAEVVQPAGQPGDVILFGEPGATYTLEQTADPTRQGGWMFVQNVTLITSFQRLEGLVPAGQTLLFRARKL